MNEHDKFLANRLLSENLPITYRAVSAHLGVHVNAAKGILYSFHKKQNALKENSVHATYLVSGRPAAYSPAPADEGDIPSSVPEQLYSIESKRVSIVAEASLRGALDSYDEVTSIHIYSLSPQENLDYTAIETYSTCATSFSSHRDATNVDAPARSMGWIRNDHVRKRDRKSRHASAGPAPSAKVKLIASNPEGSKKEVVPPVQKGGGSKTPNLTSKPPSTSAGKRSTAGGILQSFAKAAASQEQKSKEPIKDKGDALMAMSDDGEADDSDDVPSKITGQPESTKKTRKEREQELRKMMEEDDDDEVDDDASDANMEDAADNELEETNDEIEQAVDTQEEDKSAAGPKTDSEPSEIVSSVGDGRRRGKRRVVKKKRILDDQGYMVTIQEAGWESFSEDDTPKPPAKRPTPSSTPASSGAKPKKSVGKGAQGSIMSFFAKK